MKFITVLVFAFLYSVSALAYDICADGIYYNLGADVATVTYKDGKYNSYSGTVAIPESVTYNGETYAVVSIGAAAFRDCTALNSVTIGNSVTTIGYAAFSGCSVLNRIDIPNSIVSIGLDAFAECTGLKAVFIKDLDAWCRIHFSSKRSNPCYYAHILNLNNRRVTNLIIPETVNAINYYAFAGCSTLTSVTVSSSVTAIENFAFLECSSVKVLRLADGDGTLSLGYNGASKGLFSDCPIEKLYLGRNLTYSTSQSRGYSPFGNLQTLKTVAIDRSVTSIHPYALRGCTALTSVDIPNTLGSIGNNVFEGCTSLKSICIEDGENVLSLGYNSPSGGLFCDCPLETLYVGRNLSYSTTTARGNSPFYNKSTMESLTFGKYVSTIGVNVFSGCSGLRQITIPGNVRKIGSKAFEACTGLQTINLVNPVPLTIDSSTFSANALFYAKLNVAKGSESLYQQHPAWGLFRTIAAWNTGSDIKFDDEALTLHITSEAISTAELSSAENYFGQQVVIPATAEYDDRNFTVDGIANRAFSNSEVESVELPSTMAYVGVGSFADCNNLRTLILKSELPPMVVGQSFDDSHYQRVKLFVPKSSMYEYAQHEVWGRFTIADLESGIDETELDDTDRKQGSDAYNLQGVCVRRKVKRGDLDALAPGIYIIDGRKILVN